MDNKVFLYVTESGAQVEGIPTEGDVRNRVYSYTWDGTSLTNPQLLVDLPSGPGTNHQGGKLKIGPDNQAYVVVGEMQREGQLKISTMVRLLMIQVLYLELIPQMGPPVLATPYQVIQLIL